MTDATMQAIEAARVFLRSNQSVYASAQGQQVYDFACALVELAGGRPNLVDRERIENGDYIRASGDCPCPGRGRNACGYEYRKHPTVPGYEWLHRLCDGRFVKL